MKNKVLKTINIIMAMVAAVGVMAGNSESVAIPLIMMLVPCAWFVLFFSANEGRF